MDKVKNVKILNHNIKIPNGTKVGFDKDGNCVLLPIKDNEIFLCKDVTGLKSNDIIIKKLYLVKSKTEDNFFTVISYKFKKEILLYDSLMIDDDKKENEKKDNKISKQLNLIDL